MLNRIAFVFVIFPLVLLGDTDWPQFRGPDGQGISHAKGLPLTWSETNNVKWKTTIPGTGWSSPVIFGNQIWLTTALDEGKSLRAIGVDKDSGKVLHNTEVFTVPKPMFRHALNSYASPTPLIEAGRVYVCFGTYGTACVNTKSGEIIWQNRELLLDHENSPGSSPAFYRDKIIIPCDGTNVQYVAALFKKDGKLAWKTDRSGEIKKAPDMKKAYSTPLIIQVAGKPQAIIPGAEFVYAYEPDSGKEIWRAHYPGFSNVPRPVHGHGLLFIATGFGKPQMWAFRPEGQGDVSTTHVAWKAIRQAPAKPSPVLVEDQLYMISDNGIVTCLEAKTGKEIWQERIGGEYSASPVLVDSRIYFFSHDGKTTVIEPGPKLNIVATNQLGDGFMASAAISGKAFYLRSKSHLYRVE